MRMPVRWGMLRLLADSDVHSVRTGSLANGGGAIHCHRVEAGEFCAVRKLRLDDMDHREKKRLGDFKVVRRQARQKRPHRREQLPDAALLGSTKLGDDRGGKMRLRRSCRCPSQTLEPGE